MGATRPPQLRLSLGDSFGGSLVHAAAYVRDEDPDASDPAPDQASAIAAAYGQIQPDAVLEGEPEQDGYGLEESEDEYDEYYDDPSLPLHRQQRGATQLVLNHKRARSHFSIPDVVITADEADGGEKTYEVRLAEADRRSILFLPHAQAAIEESLRTGESPSSEANDTAAPAAVSFISSSSSGSLTAGSPAEASASSSPSPHPNGPAKASSTQPLRQRPGRPLVQLDEDESDPTIRSLNGAFNASLRSVTFRRPTPAVPSDTATATSTTTSTTAATAGTSLDSAATRSADPSTSTGRVSSTSPPPPVRRASGDDVGGKEKKTKRSPLGFLLLGKKNRSNTLPSLPPLPGLGQGSAAPFPSSAPATSSPAPILPPIQISDAPQRGEGSSPSPEGGGFWSNLANQPRSPTRAQQGSDETCVLRQAGSPPRGGAQLGMPSRQGSESTVASEPGKPSSKAERKAVEKERKARLKAEQALVKELASLDKIVKAHDAGQAREGARQAKALAKAQRKNAASPDRDGDASSPTSAPMPKPKSGLSRFSIFGKKAGKKGGKAGERQATSAASNPSANTADASSSRAGRPALSSSRSGSLHRQPSRGMLRSSSTRRALAALEQRNRGERGHGSGLSRSSLSAAASVRRAGSRKDPAGRAVSPGRSPSHSRRGSRGSVSPRDSPRGKPTGLRKSGVGRKAGADGVSASMGKGSKQPGKSDDAADAEGAETDWVEDDEEDEEGDASKEGMERNGEQAVARKPAPKAEGGPVSRADEARERSASSAPPAVPSSTRPVVGPMGRLRNTAQQELDRFVFPRGSPAGASA